MINFSTRGDMLVITKDPEDEPTVEEIVEACVDSSDIDFRRMVNDGAAVFLMNDYAEYQVIVYFPKIGAYLRFGIGENERAKLCELDMVVCHPYDD